MKAEMLGLQSATVHKLVDRPSALEPGPSASTVAPSSTVDCEWAFKIKPDEAAVVSWRCQYPRPPGITIHTGADAQGLRPARGWATCHWQRAWSLRLEPGSETRGRTRKRH